MKHTLKFALAFLCIGCASAEIDRTGRRGDVGEHAVWARYISNHDTGDAAKIYILENGDELIMFVSMVNGDANKFLTTRVVSIGINNHDPILIESRALSLRILPETGHTWGQSYEKDNFFYVMFRNGKSPEKGVNRAVWL